MSSPKTPSQPPRDDGPGSPTVPPLPSQDGPTQLSEDVALQNEEHLQIDVLRSILAHDYKPESNLA